MQLTITTTAAATAAADEVSCHCLQPYFLHAAAL
jgi:hypothetical protein